MRVASTMPHFDFMATKCSRYSAEKSEDFFLAAWISMLDTAMVLENTSSHLYYLELCTPPTLLPSTNSGQPHRVVTLNLNTVIRSAQEHFPSHFQSLNEYDEYMQRSGKPCLLHVRSPPPKDCHIFTIILGLTYGILMYNQRLRPSHSSAQQGPSNSRRSDPTVTEHLFFQARPTTSAVESVDDIHDTLPDTVVVVSLPSDVCFKCPYTIHTKGRDTSLLLNCLSTILVLKEKKGHDIVEVFDYIANCFCYLSSFFSVMPPTAQEHFLCDVIPWLVAWTRYPKIQGVNSPVNRLPELILCDIISSLEPSTNLTSLQCIPIHALCRTLLTCYLSSEYDVDAATTQQTAQPFLLQWLATGCRKVTSSTAVQSKEHCDNCLDTPCRYGTYEALYTPHDDYTSGAALRPFLVALLFLKTLQWLAVDNESGEELFMEHKVASLQHPSHDLMSTQCSTDHTLSSGSTGLRQILTELIRSMWTFSTTSNCNGVQHEDGFPFRLTICMLLGRKLIFHVSDVSRIPSFQSLSTFLKSDCVPHLYHLLQVTFGQYQRYISFPTQCTSHHAPHTASFKWSCYEAHLIQWTRRSHREKLRLYEAPLFINDWLPNFHLDFPCLSCFHRRPSVLHILATIPSVLELLCFSLGRSTLPQIAFLTSQTSINNAKETFNWFLSPKDYSYRLTAEQVSRFSRILDVMITAMRYTHHTESLAQHCSPYATSSLTNPVRMKDAVRPDSYDSNDDAHTSANVTDRRDNPPSETNIPCFPLFGSISCAEFARQLVMTALFHHSPASQTTLARIFRTLAESWFFNHLNISLIFLEMQPVEALHSMRRQENSTNSHVSLGTGALNTDQRRWATCTDFPSAGISHIEANNTETRVQTYGSHSATIALYKHQIDNVTPAETLITDFVTNVCYFLCTLCSSGYGVDDSADAVDRHNNKRGQSLLWSLTALFQRMNPLYSTSKPCDNTKYVPNCIGVWLWSYVGHNSLSTTGRLNVPDTPNKLTKSVSAKANASHDATPTVVHEFKNRMGLHVVHSLCTCLLHILSRCLSLMKETIGSSLVTSTCLEFIEFSIYQLNLMDRDITCTTPSPQSVEKTATSKSILLHPNELMLLVEWLQYINSRSSDAIDHSAYLNRLNEKLTPSLVAYYTQLCRKTLVGRLLIMSGIEPQLLLYPTGCQNVNEEGCSGIQQESYRIYHRTDLQHNVFRLSRAPSRLIFPLIGRQIIEDNLSLLHPPFSNPDFPINHQLLFAIGEAFRALFFCYPLLSVITSARPPS